MPDERREDPRITLLSDKNIFRVNFKQYRRYSYYIIKLHRIIGCREKTRKRPIDEKQNRQSFSENYSNKLKNFVLD